jgi:murein DD-endopeptidase MepM/ murein hydrolase activator NlpD
VNVQPLGQTGTAAATGEAASSTSSPTGVQLARLANEFESMLLTQMLREMRKSGSWADESEEKSGLGAESLFEMIDVELASHLSKAQGLGLEKSLVRQVTGGKQGADAAGETGNTLPANLPSSLPSSLPGEVSMDPTSELPMPTTPDSGADPLAGRVTTSAFGWRRDPFSGAEKYHRGVDLRAAYGEAIGAAGPGRVVFAGEQRGYGQTVVVEHAGGVQTRYAHLSSLLTETGAKVEAGQAVGRAGRSGRATGTHLHFEVTKDGHPVNPSAFKLGGLKPERVLADLAVGSGPTLPGVPRVPAGDSIGR